jgi:gamma-glutamylcyclotransferase (GGCT)/AIG2-like uncharacterized protein YtfP
MSEEGVWEGEEEEYHNVFVYGTLMKGFGNNFFLRGHGTFFLGGAKTKPEYTLYNLGHFPGMVEGGHTAVVGEVYEVSSWTLVWLDKLEGVTTEDSKEIKENEEKKEADLYERKTITVTLLEDGSSLEALVYIFPRKNIDIGRDRIIKGGVWEKKR